MGGRSRVGAQLLTGKGFKQVLNLTGGIHAWNGVEATGPVESGLELMTGEEQPDEMLRLAYGLELGLQSFYRLMAERIEGGPVKGLFIQLAQVEEAHKSRIYSLFKSIHEETAEGEPPDLNRFEAQVGRENMEGGQTTTAFIKQNKEMLQDGAGVLEMAIRIEAQALDLYLRFAAAARRPRTVEVLNRLAGDEKAHLAALGARLDAELGG